jgi:hypothetical protein
MSAYSNATKRQAHEAHSNPAARRSPARNKGAAVEHQPVAVRPRSLRAATPSCPGRDEIALKLLSLVKRVAFEMRERLPQHVDVEDLAFGSLTRANT